MILSQLIFLENGANDFDIFSVRLAISIAFKNPKAVSSKNILFSQVF